MCLVTPARVARRRTMRVAAWRLSRLPARVRKSSPAFRSPAARSMARATLDGMDWRPSSDASNGIDMST
jgi:hypothetical protein